MQEVDMYLSLPSVILSLQLHYFLEQESAMAIVSKKTGSLQVGGQGEGGSEVGMGMQVGLYQA